MMTHREYMEWCDVQMGYYDHLLWRETRSWGYYRDFVYCMN